MTAPNPMKDGAARTGDNAPADRERHRLSIGLEANGRLRPETVIRRDLAQGPLTDQKAAVGPTCIAAPAKRLAPVPQSAAKQ